MSTPFFTVIIPTLNSGSKLEATLRSILDRPDADCEVLVMDGVSTDGTHELVQRLKREYSALQWHSEPDGGIYEAMNKGIALAEGAYLYFAGAGDRLRPDSLTAVRQAAPEHGPALIYGDVQIVSSDRLHGGGGPYAPARLVYDAPCHQAIFYARELFDLLGHYESQYRVSADWAFNIKCFGDERVQKIYLDTVIADFEGSGVSANGPDTLFLRDRARLLQDFLGLKVRGSRFFAADQFLSLRIAGTRRRTARKFWRIGRWALHRLLPSGRVGEPEMTTINTDDRRRRSVLERLAARLLRFIGKQLWLFGSTRKGEPPLIPVGEILSRNENQERRSAALPIPAGWTVSNGKRLRNPFLSAALAGDELGTWALDVQTINFLEQRVSRSRPTAILEFGAGISTLCFARFMQEQGHHGNPVVLSIEQNEREAERTRARLRQLGLDHLVTIKHAPLKAQTIEGLTTECYDLPQSFLEELFEQTQPDFVVIDGPAGDETVRYGTLPLVRRHLAPHAVFFLDDAFRPEELSVARHWSELPYIHIAGLYRVGKGLLTGTLDTDPPE